MNPLKWRPWPAIALPFIIFAGCDFEREEKVSLSPLFAEAISKVREDSITIKEISLGAPIDELMHLLDEASCSTAVDFPVELGCEGNREIRIGGRDYDLQAWFWDGSSGLHEVDNLFLISATFRSNYGASAIDAVIEKFGTEFSISEKSQGKYKDGVWDPAFKEWIWNFPSRASLRYRVTNPDTVSKKTSIHMDAGFNKEIWALREQLKLKDI